MYEANSISPSTDAHSCKFTIFFCLLLLLIVQFSITCSKRHAQFVPVSMAAGMCYVSLPWRCDIIGQQVELFLLILDYMCRLYPKPADVTFSACGNCGCVRGRTWGFVTAGVYLIKSSIL